MRMVAAALVLIMLPGAVHAVTGEEFTRFGVSFGGTHIVGIYMERHSGDMSVCAEIGYMYHAISLGINTVHYFSDNEHRPYAGIGLLKHLTSEGFDHATLVTVPLGMDFHLDGRSYLGCEILPAVSFSAIRRADDGSRDLLDSILPLPRLAYKYQTD